MRVPARSAAGARALALSLALLALVSGACSRDRSGGEGTVAEAEHAAFAAPPDSTLTPAQVERYLRASLAHFELLQAEGPALRRRLAAMQAEQERPAAAAPDSASPRAPRELWSELVDEAYVRAARKLGYNPAELWYVRDRMAKVAGHLLAREAQLPAQEAAAHLRSQAEAMRGVPGVTRAQLDAMLEAADRAEAQQAPAPVPPRLAQNVRAVIEARGALSPAAWGRVAAVAAGLGVDDLGEMPEPRAAAKLTELREMYRHALESGDGPS